MPSGKFEHLVRHIQSVGEPGRADPPRRQQDIDAGTRAKVEHRLALDESGYRGRIAAAEACGHGPLRHGDDVLHVVQRRAEPWVGRLCTASGLAAGGVVCRGGVSLSDPEAEIVGHRQVLYP